MSLNTLVLYIRPTGEDAKYTPLLPGRRNDGRTPSTFGTALGSSGSQMSATVPLVMASELKNPKLTKGSSGVVWIDVMIFGNVSAFVPETISIVVPGCALR